MALDRVVIIGGGFGGLRCAQQLKKANVTVTLIDRTNHHLFQPLLYQVATSGLTAKDIAAPLREILKKQENTSVVMDEVVEIRKDEQKVLLKSGKEVGYDHLVVAIGNRHSYFGHPEWEEHAPGLKCLSDALMIKNRILTSYELAEASDCRKEVERLLTFVVVGGGPTGVELAGAIAEIAHKTMLRNFRRIDTRQTRIYLVEGADQLLLSFPPELAKQAKKDLEALGVRVLLSTKVTDIDEQGVTLDDRRIEANCVFWAAGNEVAPFLQSLDSESDRGGRIMVNDDLSVPEHPEIFVIGDAAHVKDQDGAPLPGIAPVAMQQGTYVAKKITSDKELGPFAYKDRGSMATIGKARAVAVVGKRMFTGFTAWILWCLIHVAFLIGFRNKLIVMLEWTFWYITEHRSSRIICRTDKAQPNTPRK